MSKITLITHSNNLTSFNADYLKPLLEKYFNIVEYDATTNYDPKSSLVVIGHSYGDSTWQKNLNNIKCVVVNLWERGAVETVENALTLTNKNWFWYNEAYWYQHLGYSSYVPDRGYTHTAFMPVRLKRPERDLAFKKLKNHLDNMIYSYVEDGIYLPGDVPHDLDVFGGNFQRYFNPAWYDSTYFSIVLESKINDPGNLFISEKTFKPIAFLHPFMIIGQPGILKYLHELGFETFENMFDESYDDQSDYTSRLDLIESNIENFKFEKYSNITLEKLNHNKHLFFDQTVLEPRIVKEIFNPMIEFLEK